MLQFVVYSKGYCGYVPMSYFSKELEAKAYLETLRKLNPERKDDFTMDDKVEKDYGF